jgi:TetR/AcrR family transcriptional regulator, cholesterol catabolism regulator
MDNKAERRTNGGRRDDILALFTKLVAQKGYECTNFGEISKVLGLSKGTIVHHFTNKQSLLIESHVAFVDRHADHLLAVINKVKDPAEKLACFIHYMVSLYEYDRDATIAFVRETVTFRDDPDMQQIRTLRRVWFDMLVSVIDEGVETGILREVDSRVTARYIFGMTNWMWTWFNPEGGMTAAEAASHAIKLAVGGIARDYSKLESFSSSEGAAAKFVREAFS